MGQTRQADTAPLWYTTYGGGDGMGYRSSEVDDVGRCVGNTANQGLALLAFQLQ